MPNCKHYAQDAASTSRADGNPALLTAFRLVFQKGVVSKQDVLRVGTADTVSREMLFIVLVPVELARIVHCL